MTRKKIARLHMRVSRVRSEAIHKATPEIVAKAKPCSRCGLVKEDLTLCDRVFRCEFRGHVADRDDNASDNIRLLAASSAERLNGCGGEVRPSLSRGHTPVKRQSGRVA